MSAKTYDALRQRAGELLQRYLADDGSVSIPLAGTWWWHADRSPSVLVYRSDPARTAWQIGEGLRRDDDLPGVVEQTRSALRLPWISLRG